MRTPISPDEATKRLKLIFPRGAFDTTLSNDLAGWAISSLIYINAVAPQNSEPEVWARPTAVIWQQEDVLSEKTSDTDRQAWRAAAAKNFSAVQKLLNEWQVPVDSRFRENSRETLRDEILTGWKDLGAVRQRQGLPTSSSKPRWALESHFADLFNPALAQHELISAIESWTSQHLDAGARLKARRARALEAKEFEVAVTLPGGDVRKLEHGKSSLILKGVIEEWAPQRLKDPVVLTISEPGAKLLVQDQLLLAELGVAIDVGNLLPDALIADLGVNPVEFWVIEAVATSGPITERRKEELLAWAEEQRIRPETCYFLTAFASRNASPAKRHLKDLAGGTYAWYLDEPEMELAWNSIEARACTSLFPVSNS
ncbi:hypothetical protein CATRI_13180 (plasmid) [Corynebacterium atrinae]|uniref:BsuBI/PstI family type II restriction endonuclease n=1 Tax=Corynebacterium atrinae TaxID=1336740 RepID=UPI0025B603C7|nr:BsuBI/PstI family type II restriction endonuclease [Corynebacterium atrinae]WJY64681.1 hypothetical protein CATRI_13180 [Corynebacterium atrinae]